ncbi:sigma factor-like helix-turn-helix DNA-binding protein [Halorarum salinum]|uniref:RNA polymerase sigma factor 70 region 4 type 2 domain-containing protein n=1 Tax=Halorarum salinum TaxID=2743089 RepID=A0A7D5L8H8_9EURY|nr:sigma factor-like helix-turn-helix DNA-binding protein [Halobaculum salinum]QLG60367.1 hypothetical protein HUG12_00800 [Halobaculum salinum]
MPDTTDADTDVDAALADAKTMVETDAISHRQAEVYALCELHGIGRAETAVVLNLSPDTVESHLEAARRNVREARDLVDFLETTG